MKFLTRQLAKCNGGLPVFHLDFYRLEDEDGLLAIGWDKILEQDGIVISERAGRFPRVLPADAQWLRFTIGPDGTRRVE